MSDGIPSLDSNLLPVSASGFAFVLSSLCFKASVRQDLAQLFVPRWQLLGELHSCLNDKSHS